ncbi:error-prone DNA polymerase [Longispora albida]|uniref:error-prone DNA polymerase n=1 Tax=Longispora albida TaxID=203523 RepID=UPI00037EC5DA|nr:error-prone DNA polymerase [Longispora albida]
MTGWDSGHRKSWPELRKEMVGQASSPPRQPPVTDVLADCGDRDGYPDPRCAAPHPAPVALPHYAELHAHTNFSFLDGASEPEELVAEARRLRLAGLAITDHNGLYGVARFAAAARAAGLATVFGSELSLTPPAGPGEADPGADHLLVLARHPAGYREMSAVIGRGQLAGGEKGKPAFDLEEISAALKDQVLVLTGCRKGAVRSALERDGRQAARDELRRLVRLFGADSVAVELIDHGQPLDRERNDALAELAAELVLPVVATNNVHYARPGQHRLAGVLAAVRARRSLDEMDGWLPAAGGAHLRSGKEMAARFARYPDAIRRSVTFMSELWFDLKLIAPELPCITAGGRENESAVLRELALEGARRRYPPGGLAAGLAQVERELAVIEKLQYPGYFLIVHDIVRECERRDIYCQGRGSAANSVVCYALGITNVDPIARQLLFERFLSADRDGPPDIDVDIESDRREEIIQYVYGRYGREHAAQVANVISYRPKSAVRDVARAFGYSPGQQDAWSKQLSHWGEAGEADGLPEQVVTYANKLLRYPRHLGIHSGGMVICDRPVIEVVPVEWARMEGRTVIQWDKDDCAEAGLVKFDLLGLGMLSAVHYAVDLVSEHHGVTIDRATLPEDDPEVYDMLCRADAVGVFQVESRAQLATLPRLRPRTFYDLVVEIALIRPGPIQGGSVHPYIRRRNDEEPVEYPHPSVREVLKRTYGVPLFQEQLMQMAIALAGFTPDLADQLRRAMGSKRSLERMERLRERFFAGMAGNGIVGEEAGKIYGQLAAFANYGFPESHAISFAHLTYVSSYLKRYYPAAFLAALLRAQPMGFYSVQSLTEDARRHGVRVGRPDINRSGVHATLEGRGFPPAAKGAPPEKWGRGGPAVRLGLAAVRGIGEELAGRIVAGQPYQDMADVSRRCELTTAQLESLSTADAFGCFGLSRREALWAAGAAAQERADRLPGTISGTRAPMLPGMADVELAGADIWATGLSPDSHPVQFARAGLTRLGAAPIAALAGMPDKAHGVLVGGIVTHRQRPQTAGGVTFLNLEDETGMLNVVCTQGLWSRYRVIARSSAALLVRGRLTNANGVVSLHADKLSPLPVPIRTGSRDFR